MSASAATLASRARIEPSATLAMNARARAMRERGLPVISLAVGEPDLPTPEPVRRAAARAVEEGYTRYTATAGLPEVREAVAADLAGRGLSYDPATEVVVTVGAKQALFNLFQTICEPGDEVILPAPTWVSYPHMVELAGARPVPLPVEDDLSTSPEAVARLCGPRTRAFVSCTPSNPTGVVLDEATLRAVDEVLPPEVLVVSDEIYGHLTYDGARHVSFASLSDAARRRTVVCDGVSKAYAMTGWRVGWAAGPADVIGGMATIQGHQTSNAAAPCQMAAKAALESGVPAREEMREVFADRRELVLERLEAIPGVRVVRPRGAFYVFPDVSALLGGDGPATALELAESLLEEEHVAVVPGEAFGAPGHIRLSYAASTDDLEEALDRLARFVEGG